MWRDARLAIVAQQCNAASRVKIAIVTPAAARSRNGNRNTAARWARLLRDLGHRVSIEQAWSGGSADLMIALHARRSHDSIARYAQRHPGRALVVVLTGTDLYRDLAVDANAKRSLELATRLVVLQDRGLLNVPRRFRDKTRVIYQSAHPVARPEPLATCFEVVVSGHLRHEKDPFRAAAALSHLPASSRIRVTHLGGALEDSMALEARRWMAREPRYRWRGELPHARARQVLARSRLMVISSRMEGGANVVCEALACGVPVLASRIAGNLGMLGADYPGYFTLENEKALTRLLHRAETDRAYYERLKKACAARAHLVRPRAESAALRKLIAELASA